MPMPTPVPPGLVVAAPSPLAAASVLLCALSESAPPDSILRPSPIVASECVIATATPTAPATCTAPLEVSVEPLLSVFPVALVSVLESALLARVSAALAWLWVWLLTPPLSSLLSFVPASVACPPATLATAWASSADPTLGEKVTAPSALTSRAVLATALSSATVTAMEIPTPVSPDLVSPSAIVSEPPLCDALSETAPLHLSTVPLKAPSFALVSLVETATATTGVIAVSPFAPPSARVSIWLLEPAERVTLCASSSAAPSPMIAPVPVTPTFTAIDAPMPKLLAPSCCAFAVTVLLTKFCAFSSTSLLPVTVTLALSAIAAVAWLMPTLTASDPATPVSPLLAPETALALKLSLLSASIFSPAAVTSASPIFASVLTTPTLTATPMPTPVPVLSVFALPSALVAAPVLLTALRLSAPPDLTVRPSAIVACASVIATVTPAAPATCTLPSAVSPVALPSVLPADPLDPPDLLPRSSAKLLWLCTWLLMPPPWSLLSFAVAALLSPPATLAFACDLLPAVVRALKLTAPSASILRAVPAMALSVATVSAIEMPTPVSPDFDRAHGRDRQR